MISLDLSEVIYSARFNRGPSSKAVQAAPIVHAARSPSAGGPAGRVVGLRVGRGTDEGGGVEEHACRAVLDVVVAGDVAVDVLAVVAGVREEEGAGGQGLRGAGVGDVEGCHGGAVELVQRVGHAGVGLVVPHVMRDAGLEPRPAPHVALDVPVRYKISYLG